MSGAAPKNRIEWLDAWRGLAVGLMLGWHLAWDLALWGYFPLSRMFSPGAAMVRYFIVGSFTLIAGMSSRLSRSAVRHGTVTLGFAFVITAVTVWLGDPVIFGVLHMLGCCMLLSPIMAKLLDRFRPAAACMGLTAVFTALFMASDKLRIQNPWFWILGFRTREFYSADYYPLLPWGLLFAVGVVLGKKLLIPRESRPLLAFWRPFVWLGRRAMPIYLIHQPLLAGALWLITGRTPWT